MCQLSKKLFILLIVLVLLLVGCKSSFKSEDILSTEQKEHASFSVKITAFRERQNFGQALAGADYIFEAKNRAEQAWRKFMTVKYDDPIPIDKNSIVLINERIGYVFMVKKFAVTTNSGLNWSIWDIGNVKALKDDLSCKIQSVRIEEGGTGLLNMKCNKAENTLSTNDYGITWQ
jgi:hypothetical protein